MISRNVGAALAALLTLGWAAPAMPGDSQVYYVLEGSAVKHDDVRDGDEYTGGLRVGLGLGLSGTDRGTAVELAVFGNPIERHPVAEGTQLGLMLDLVQAFDFGALDPFLLGGVGVVREEDASGDPTLFPAIEAGIGVLVGRRLRVSLSVQDVLNDDLTPAQDAFLDYRLNLGLRFGAGEPAAAPPLADGDGDGVPDARDRCPKQPAATADGCPAAPPVPAVAERDSDRDGVPDSKDECPGTLAGLKVDASGCVAATGAQQRVVLKGVNFLPGSVELTPEARAVLDEAAAALGGQAALKVEIGGHTDSRGDEKLNQALSQRRAESVRSYLIGKGIAAARLRAKGYGEAQPIADNATRAGRQENRRVELKIVQ